MKKQRIIVTLLIALAILCTSSTAALATSVGDDDQFTNIYYYDRVFWPVTINNESTEVFSSYSSSQNYVYEHYNDGTVINAVSLPFDIYVSNNTKLYSDSTLSGTISNWENYDVIYNPNNLYYPGKADSPAFLLSKSKDVTAKITYGYMLYSDEGLVGYDDDNYTFTLW